MRKFLCAIAALTLALGLTACGSEVKYTDYEQSKIDYAVSLAQDGVLGVMGSFMDGSIPADAFDEYTNEEVAYVISNNFGLQTDGYAFKNAIKSFTKAAPEVGTISAVRGYDVSIDGDQIIVLLDVDGTKRDAQAEIIFSNDMFMELESAALNTYYSFGEKMKSAGLNTLIGMVTVYPYENRYVRFKDTRNVWAMILRLAGAFAIYAVLNNVLKMPFNKEWLNNGTLGANLIRTARYAIILFTIVGVYPRVFPLFERIGKKSNS